MKTNYEPILFPLKLELKLLLMTWTELLVCHSKLKRILLGHGETNLREITHSLSKYHHMLSTQTDLFFVFGE